MENAWNFSPATSKSYASDSIFNIASKVQSLRKASPLTAELPEFRKITHEDMPKVWEFLSKEKGLTTDFSYG
ncbi:MAG: hypothetical protein K2M10_09070 [Muribaculaceae bacterium]|nr:hypothetical protein [Muribaculaceae bacterium]